MNAVQIARRIVEIDVCFWHDTRRVDAQIRARLQERGVYAASTFERQGRNGPS